jgi:hypothetical protein
MFDALAEFDTVLAALSTAAVPRSRRRGTRSILATIFITMCETSTTFSHSEVVIDVRE